MRYVSLLLIFVLVVPIFAQSSTQSSLSDDRIYDEVRRRLANDIDVKGGGLDVSVKNGEVTLRGKVHDNKAREKAEKLTKKVKGVVKVENQLTIFGQD